MLWEGLTPLEDRLWKYGCPGNTTLSQSLENFGSQNEGSFVHLYFVTPGFLAFFGIFLLKTTSCT